MLTDITAIAEWFGKCFLDRELSGSIPDEYPLQIPSSKNEALVYKASFDEHLFSRVKEIQVLIETQEIKYKTGDEIYNPLMANPSDLFSNPRFIFMNRELKEIKNFTENLFKVDRIVPCYAWRLKVLGDDKILGESYYLVDKFGTIIESSMLWGINLDSLKIDESGAIGFYQLETAIAPARFYITLLNRKNFNAIIEFIKSNNSLTN